MSAWFLQGDVRLLERWAMAASRPADDSRPATGWRGYACEATRSQMRLREGPLVWFLRPMSAAMPFRERFPLRIFPGDWRCALRDVALVVVGLTLACLMLDGLIFRGALPPGYVGAYTSALWPRTLLTCLQAAREELIYRLVLTTTLVALVTVVRDPADRSPPWVAFLAAQAVLVWPSVLAAPLWASLRFWLVGSVWGWLYWRRGFLAALLGHGVIHLMLDPLLRLAL